MCQHDLCSTCLNELLAWWWRCVRLSVCITIVCVYTVSIFTVRACPLCILSSWPLHHGQGNPSSSTACVPLWCDVVRSEVVISVESLFLSLSHTDPLPLLSSYVITCPSLTEIAIALASVARYTKASVLFPIIVHEKLFVSKIFVTVWTSVQYGSRFILIEDQVCLSTQPMAPLFAERNMHTSCLLHSLLELAPHSWCTDVNTLE